MSTFIVNPYIIIITINNYASNFYIPTRQQLKIHNVKSNNMTKLLHLNLTSSNWSPTSIPALAARLFSLTEDTNTPPPDPTSREVILIPSCSVLFFLCIRLNSPAFSLHTHKIIQVKNFNTLPKLSKYNLQLFQIIKL